jgi:hypothetical protein
VRGDPLGPVAVAVAVARTTATFPTVVAFMMATVLVVVEMAMVVVIPLVVAVVVALPLASRAPLPASGAPRRPGRTGGSLAARSRKGRGREPKRHRPVEAGHMQDARREGHTGSRSTLRRTRHRPRFRHGVASTGPPVATLTDQSGPDRRPGNEQQRERDQQRGGKDERNAVTGPRGATHLPGRCTWRRGRLRIQSLGEGTLGGPTACWGTVCAPRAPFASQSSLHNLSKPGRPQCMRRGHTRSIP